MSRYVISGYYGFGNAGDEAILRAMVGSLRAADKDASITVLSANPAATSAEHKVTAIHRTKMGPIIRSLRQADLFISGGGGLLQDVTSSRSLLYYLGLIRLAKACGCKLMLYANSLGPIRRPVNRRLMRRVLGGMDYITVRDEPSLRFLRDIGVSTAQAEIVSDPVLLLDTPDVKRQNKTVVMAVREWPSSHDYAAEVVKAGKVLVASGFTVRFLPLHYDRDLSVSQRLAHEIGDGAYCLKDELSVDALLEAIAGADVVVSMRLHALIMGMVAQRPLIGISYDPKVDGFLQQAKQPVVGSVHELSAGRLVDAVEEAYNRQAEISAELSVRLVEQRKLAARSAEIAASLVKGVAN